MELFNSLGYRRLQKTKFYKIFLELFRTKYETFMKKSQISQKISYFVLKSSVNFIELCSVIACIRVVHGLNLKKTFSDFI